MKPIVIFKTPDENGNIGVTADELKELIEKAYEQGLEDGKKVYNMPAQTLPSVWHGTYQTPAPVELPFIATC
jgi:hypothetical protein